MRPVLRTPSLPTECAGLREVHLPVLHQEGAHEAAVSEVDGVIGPHGDDVHGDTSPLHVFEGLADLTRKDKE